MKPNFRSLALAACLGLSPVVAVLFSGCAGNPPDRSAGERTTGEYIDDKTLNARVRSALSDNQEYKFNAVQVNSFRGTVQLSGFVNTSAQKQRAGEIAKNVAGAKSVENKITVKDSTSSN